MKELEGEVQQLQKENLPPDGKELEGEVQQPQEDTLPPDMKELEEEVQQSQERKTTTWQEGVGGRGASAPKGYSSP